MTAKAQSFIGGQCHAGEYGEVWRIELQLGIHTHTEDNQGTRQKKILRGQLAEDPGLLAG